MGILLEFFHLWIAPLEPGAVRAGGAPTRRGAVSKKASLLVTATPALAASEAKSCAKPCTSWPQWPVPVGLEGWKVCTGYMLHVSR